MFSFIRSVSCFVSFRFVLLFICSLVSHVCCYYKRNKFYANFFCKTFNLDFEQCILCAMSSECECVSPLLLTWAHTEKHTLAHTHTSSENRTTRKFCWRFKFIFLMRFIFLFFFVGWNTFFLCYFSLFLARQKQNFFSTNSTKNLNFYLFVCDFIFSLCFQKEIFCNIELNKRQRNGMNEARISHL